VCQRNVFSVAIEQAHDIRNLNPQVQHMVAVPPPNRTPMTHPRADDSSAQDAGAARIFRPRILRARQGGPEVKQVYASEFFRGRQSRRCCLQLSARCRHLGPVFPGAAQPWKHQQSCQLAVSAGALNFVFDQPHSEDPTPIRVIKGLAEKIRPLLIRCSLTAASVQCQYCRIHCHLLELLSFPP
jgi:hypothetical protein